LLKQADQAMYAAKRQGRDRFCYFTPAMQAAAESRLRLTNDLRNALAENQFRLVFQPIVELATGDIQKAEALVRWQRPMHGLVSPAEFIPIAEATGTIIEIGEWVFHQAVNEVARWRRHHHAGFQVSINESPVQFHNNSDTLSGWAEHLRHLDQSGSCVVVEITEGLLLDASPLVSEKLLAYRDAGIQVALDDFGTGYSSLAYLKKFDIDYLKIDQTFVHNLAANSTDLALCEAMILMAHKLGIKVIAEGIETPAQRDLLLQAGCDYGQGYLFSRPVPAEEFEKLLYLSLV
jgi:EAL domain-containing protein (putative c-di-GMP-specific phosphodiesterase class I)